MVIGQILSKTCDVLAKIAAFFVLAAYVVFAINANWAFITNDTLSQVISYLMYYGPIAVCGLVLLEFGLKRNIIIKIIVLAIVAVVVIFQFFPDTFNSIVQQINP